MSCIRACRWWLHFIVFFLSFAVQYTSVIHYHLSQTVRVLQPVGKQIIDNSNRSFFFLRGRPPYRCSESWDYSIPRHPDCIPRHQKCLKFRLGRPKVISIRRGGVDGISGVAGFRQGNRSQKHGSPVHFLCASKSWGGGWRVYRDAPNTVHPCPPTIQYRNKKGSIAYFREAPIDKGEQVLTGFFGGAEHWLVQVSHAGDEEEKDYHEGLHSCLLGGCRGFSSM